MMSRIHFQFLAALLTGLAILPALAPPAHAHAILTFPTPRPGSSTGNTSGPCGAAASTPTPLQAGSSVTITWDETIHHSGNFQMYLAPGAVNTTGNGLPLNLPSPVPALPSFLYAVPQTFADANVPHHYSATVTLPANVSGAYTLQFFQVNTDPDGGGTPRFRPPRARPPVREDFIRRLPT
jgi:hypothetical protein